MFCTQPRPLCYPACRRFFAARSVLGVLAFAHAADPRGDLPHAPLRLPAEEQAFFPLPLGFEIRLVAAEPEIRKPMNGAFDAAGRVRGTGSTLQPWPARLLARSGRCEGGGDGLRENCPGLLGADVGKVVVVCVIKVAAFGVAHGPVGAIEEPVGAKHAEVGSLPSQSFGRGGGTEAEGFGRVGGEPREAELGLLHQFGDDLAEIVFFAPLEDGHLGGEDDVGRQRAQGVEERAQL